MKDIVITIDEKGIGIKIHPDLRAHEAVGLLNIALIKAYEDIKISKNEK